MTEIVFTNDFLAALAMRHGGTVHVTQAELEAAPRQVRITHGSRGTDYIITAHQPTIIKD
jgi:hypothetical protein